VPIVALLLSLFVVYPTWGRYTDLRTRIGVQRAERDGLRAAPRPDVGAVVPAENDLPSEPPKFLGQVRLLADLAGCRVKGFELSPTPKSEGQPARAVRAHVEIEGRYSQIRNFLVSLTSAPRLYVITELNMEAAKIPGSNQPGAVLGIKSNQLNAGIGIERYVTTGAL